MPAQHLQLNLAKDAESPALPCPALPCPALPGPVPQTDHTFLSSACQYLPFSASPVPYPAVPGTCQYLPFSISPVPYPALPCHAPAMVTALQLSYSHSQAEPKSAAGEEAAAVLCGGGRWAHWCGGGRRAAGYGGVRPGEGVPRPHHRRAHSSHRVAGPCAQHL